MRSARSLRCEFTLTHHEIALHNYEFTADGREGQTPLDPPGFSAMARVGAQAPPLPPSPLTATALTVYTVPYSVFPMYLYTYMYMYMYIGTYTCFPYIYVYMSMYFPYYVF